MCARRLALASIALLIPLCASGAQAGDRYHDALKAYEEAMQSNALAARTQGRARLGQSRDPRAFAILSKGYAKPEDPETQVRYLIAHISSQYFTEPDWIDPWNEWLGKDTKPRDAWLWFLGHSIQAQHASPRRITACVDEEMPVFLRAAAVAGVAASKRREGAKRLAAELDALPKKPFARGVMLCSLAPLALALKKQLKKDETQAAVERLIRQIDVEDTPSWAALAIGRHVSHLLELPDVTLDSRYLLQTLWGKTVEGSPDDIRYGGRPTFVGLKASGQRICYVIDCSDLMLTPLSGKERTSLRKPVVTGAPDPSRKKKGGIEDEIDWDKVKNRFDLAREFVRLSLEMLQKDQSFAVVCFGTEAQLLKGTKGMQRAKPGAIKKALKQLGALKTGKPTATRVHGTLMGDTNFHGALMTAFRVTSKGLVKEPEYIAKKGFLEGCDTIFFLSDGRPTADDWPGTGRMEGPGGFVDPETGAKIDTPGGGSGEVELRGPYSDGGHYLDGEVQRMNLLRRVEIHCVGIGEARAWQLKSIAKQGLGTVRMIGDDDD